MKKIIFITKFLIIYLLLVQVSFSANLNYYDHGKKLFDDEQFEKSKFFFEKDIVFNPKSEKSYLHLAKIFNKKDDFQKEELNLNNVLLLNPNNDEAIYMLILIKIEQYDYDIAKSLIEKFNLVCKSFCAKKEIINKKFSKLTPENDKNKN